MGSMITLGVGKLEIDWGKNNFFTNHSRLFLPSDVCKIPYYYADNVIENKEGLSRPLKDIKRRLELLGYPLHSLRSQYESLLSSMPDYCQDVPISFDEFYQVIFSLDIAGSTLMKKGVNLMITTMESFFRNTFSRVQNSTRFPIGKISLIGI